VYNKYELFIYLNIMFKNRERCTLNSAPVLN
jgi:hypothetical protein